VELGVFLAGERGSGLGHALAALFLLASMVFVYRAFYGMRIEA
jgi:hypothetical protein